MEKTLCLTLFLVSLLAAGGCHFGGLATDNDDELRMINKLRIATSSTASLKTTLSCINLNNPSADLARNFEHKDYRFIGICGYVCETPGLEMEDPKHEYPEYFGIRNLDGTSDVIEGDEHYALIQQATEYASKYNVLLLKRLKELEWKRKSRQ